MNPHITQLQISRRARSALTALTLLSASLSASAAPIRDFHAWAATPPMGWNSWDCFGTTVTEAQTEVIDRHTPSQGVELDVDITGAKTLHLIADDAGDGITGDFVVWSDPRITGPAGELRLTKQGWLSATAGWGKVAVGIGAHAAAHLAFAVPPGYTRFQAFAALDDAGIAHEHGATVRFRVLASDTAVTTSATVRVPLADLGFSGKVKVRDLWSRADLAPASGEISAEAPAHGARLFRVGPAR